MYVTTQVIWFSVLTELYTNIKISLLPPVYNKFTKRP